MIINVSLFLIGFGAIIFALSGNCLTNGVDMPKPAIVGIGLFLCGCMTAILGVLEMSIRML